MSSYLKRARDPISSLTHLLGAVFFAFGTVLLLVKGLITGSGTASVAAALAFGFSLIALYSTSAAYHFSNASERAILILRKLDHSMIYVLIAGSYTPILLHYFPAPKSILMTAAIWGLAALGIAVKLLWFSAPRALYTAFYIMMGWFILLDLPALAAMETAAIWMLVLGGVSYTAGGVCYALKWPNLSKSFGHHEFFHLLVLLGSLLHYLIVFIFVV